MTSSAPVPRPPLRGSILLFHGLTSSPDELTSLTDALADAGFTAAAPPLAGHGDIHTLKRVRIETWLTDAAQSLHAIRQSTPPGPLFVGGLSFGALLALHLALRSDTPIRGLILLAPPFQLRRRLDEIQLQLLRHLPDSVVDSLGIRPKSRAHETRLVLPRQCLTHHSIGSAVRMVKLRHTLLAESRQLSTPVLIVQDPHDHLVHPDGVDPFIEVAENAEVDTIWLPGGEHELTLGPRHHEVSHVVIEFMNRLCLAN